MAVVAVAVESDRWCILKDLSNMFGFAYGDAAYGGAPYRISPLCQLIDPVAWVGIALRTESADFAVTRVLARVHAQKTKFTGFR